ncbi:hypothetical protein ACQ86N_31180 [Puia sp. P3]|uniref:hypothetical protein n=1 Tax=Puia sp. P3 TaxID=3423952 RepID=UPI003D6766CF
MVVAQDLSAALGNEDVQVGEDGHFGRFEELTHGKRCLGEAVFFGGTGGGASGAGTRCTGTAGTGV